MTQTPLNTRVEDRLKAVLLKVAKKEGVSLARLIEKILEEWAKARGYLKNG
jgi:predicted HicB family RNase H-like nuclease